MAMSVQQCDIVADICSACASLVFSVESCRNRACVSRASQVNMLAYIAL